MNQSSSPSKARNLSSLSLLSLVILIGAALLLITRLSPALAVFSSPLSVQFSSPSSNPDQSAASLHPGPQPIPVPPPAQAAANVPVVASTPAPPDVHPAPVLQPVPTPPAGY